MMTITSLQQNAHWEVVVVRENLVRRILEGKPTH